MARGNIKREVDLQIMVAWIGEGQRVLDLGCGRGVLLDHLIRSKQARGLGVDIATDKVTACVKKGVPAYQGDIEQLLAEFPDQAFDWVICSRTVHELSHPRRVILEALRVGKQLAVGFTNHGYWVNRWSVLTTGQRPLNDVYSERWEESRPSNPLSVADFERFCRQENIRIAHRHFLDGEWKSPITFQPNLLAGYALYAISREQASSTESA